MTFWGSFGVVIGKTTPKKDSYYPKLPQKEDHYIKSAVLSGDYKS